MTIDLSNLTTILKQAPEEMNKHLLLLLIPLTCASASTIDCDFDKDICFEINGKTVTLAEIAIIDPELRDKNGYRPLFLAQFREQNPDIPFLLPQDADPYKQDENKQSDVAKIRRAAEQGNIEAQFKLGNMFYKGEGTAQDEGKAFIWYRRAAEQGLASAQHNLGHMLKNGEGTVQNFDNAYKWFRRAADQGIAESQFAVGLLYERGNGPVQSLEKAFQWYSKAAKQGLASAQYNLGIMIYYGDGTDRDIETAYKWLRKAYAQGDLDAHEALESICRRKLVLC